MMITITMMYRYVMARRGGKGETVWPHTLPSQDLPLYVYGTPSVVVISDYRCFMR